MLVSFEGVAVDPELEIIALTEHSWRVCDSRFSPAEPEGLLAYVERETPGYNVLLMRPGHAESLHADCLAAAMALISARRTQAQRTPEALRTPADRVPL